MDGYIKILSVAVVVGLLGFAVSAFAGEGEEKSEGLSVLSHKVKDMKGREVKLEKYKGKVLLLVNVASECGLTPQYEALQELHDKYSKDGLAILGFPANNFGGQEPGTNTEIYQFCTSTYNVKFDLFSKISVKGDDIDPLYKDLTSKEKNGEFAGDIEWNFAKFLVDREGNVVKRFAPRVKPESKEIVAAIEGELKKETSEEG
jgi:glutathione peroxidase